MADVRDNPTHNTNIAGAIEPDDEARDDGYAETTTSSYCTSIASDIRKGRLENGRVYASYGQNEYGLPVDDDELDRIDMNNTKYTLLQDDQLFLAPLDSDPEKVLDIGTGTGIWAIEMADKYPSASVIGTDIAPIQATWVPPNCSFEIEDAEAQWPYKADSFDYIHGRDMYHSIRDWPKLIEQAYKATKPGGFLELACVVPEPKSDDGTLPARADSTYVEVCATFQDIAERIGAVPNAPYSYRSWMMDAGYIDVHERVLKIPTSPWPRDTRLKRIGGFELMNVLEGAQGALLRGYTSSLGKTREELEVLLARMRKELLTLKFHSYVSFVVVFGRKSQA